MKYRFLKEKEIVQEGDEVLELDGIWRKSAVSVGCRCMIPGRFRRLIPGKQLTDLQKKFLVRWQKIQLAKMVTAFRGRFDLSKKDAGELIQQFIRGE